MLGVKLLVSTARPSVASRKATSWRRRRPASACPVTARRRAHGMQAELRWSVMQSCPRRRRGRVFDLAGSAVERELWRSLRQKVFADLTRLVEHRVMQRVGAHVAPVKIEAIFRRGRLSPGHLEDLIRFPADHLGLAILGHQWKPAWLLIFGRSAARATQRAEITLSSVSRSGTCLLTIGSSTSVQSVSAGCTSGV